MIRSGVPAVLMLLALGGCSFVPVSEPLAVSPPSSFSRSGDQQQADEWWLEFHDTRLEQLITSALAENFTLKASWERLNQAEAIVRQSGAGLLPEVTATAGSARIREDSGSSIKNSDSQSFGILASYELDLWGRVAATKDAAVADYMTSAESLNTAAVTLAASITNTWYRLQTQHGHVRLLDSQLDNVNDTLKLIRMRYQYGQVTMTDVLQQEQLQKSTAADLVLAQSEKKVLEQQLNILLGNPPMAVISWNYKDLPALPALPDTGLPAELAARRPDLQQAWYRYESARYSVAVAKADRMPALSLKASFDSSAEDWGNLFDAWVLNLAGNLAAPVFDGGHRQAEVDRTTAVASEALYDYTQSVLDALGEVETALARESAQVLYLDGTREQVELSRKILQQVQLRYSKGSEDFLAVLTAQEKLYGLERQLLTAQQQQLEYRVDLYRALGGGLLVSTAEKVTALPKQQNNVTKSVDNELKK